MGVLSSFIRTQKKQSANTNLTNTTKRGKHFQQGHSCCTRVRVHIACVCVCVCVCVCAHVLMTHHIVPDKQRAAHRCQIGAADACHRRLSLIPTSARCPPNKIYRKNEEKNYEQMHNLHNSVDIEHRKHKHCAYKTHTQNQHSGAIFIDCASFSFMSPLISST